MVFDGDLDTTFFHSSEFEVLECHVSSLAFIGPVPAKLKSNGMPLPAGSIACLKVALAGGSELNDQRKKSFWFYGMSIGCIACGFIWLRTKA